MNGLRLPKLDLKQMVAVRSWFMYFALMAGVAAGGIAEPLSFWPQFGVCAGTGFVVGFVYRRTSRTRGIILLGLTDDEQQTIAARLRGGDQ